MDYTAGESSFQTQCISLRHEDLTQKDLAAVQNNCMLQRDEEACNSSSQRKNLLAVILVKAGCSCNYINEVIFTILQSVRTLLGWKQGDLSEAGRVRWKSHRA